MGLLDLSDKIKTWWDAGIYFKNGYSLWKHLIPFSLAALLLLILSVQPEDKMVKFLCSLQHSTLWLPAIILTIAATLIYLLTFLAQIKKAYFFKDNIFQRTIITSIIYILICFGIAYVVLSHALIFPNKVCEPSIFANIWTCYLIAILSLTGIGWPGLGSWVDDMGISPDYTETRYLLENLMITLKRLRKKQRSNQQDIIVFRKGASDLLSSLEKNTYLEPRWARQDIELICNNLDNLIFLTDRNFMNKDDDISGDFATACSYQDPGLKYTEFIETLKGLCTIWQRAI